jgi:hypothetical protein
MRMAIIPLTPSTLSYTSTNTLQIQKEIFQAAVMWRLLLSKLGSFDERLHDLLNASTCLRLIGDLANTPRCSLLFLLDIHGSNDRSLLSCAITSCSSRVKDFNASPHIKGRWMSLACRSGHPPCNRDSGECATISQDITVDTRNFR